MPEAGELVRAYRDAGPLQQALAHFNYAATLQELPGRLAELQAHLLAAGAIFHRLQSPYLERAVSALATRPLDKGPPTAVDLLEQLGAFGRRSEVDFAGQLVPTEAERAMLDATLAAVWLRARQQQAAGSAAAAHLPGKLQQALASGRRQAVRDSLVELTPGQLEQAIRGLMLADALDEPTAQLLRELYQQHRRELADGQPEAPDG